MEIPQEWHVWAAILDAEQVADLTERDMALNIIAANHPEEPGVWLAKAFLAEDYRDYDGAKACYLKALELDPAASVFYNLAMLLENHFGDYRQAADYYHKAIATDPNHCKSYNNLGKLLADQFDAYDEARNVYLQGLMLEPADAHLNHNLGYLLSVHFNHYEDALQHFSRALASDGGNADLCNDLGVVLGYHLNRAEAAREYFLKAIELSPFDAFFHINFSVLLDKYLGEVELYFTRDKIVGWFCRRTGT